MLVTVFCAGKCGLAIPLLLNHTAPPEKKFRGQIESYPWIRPWKEEPQNKQTKKPTSKSGVITKPSRHPKFTCCSTCQDGMVLDALFK